MESAFLMFVIFLVTFLLLLFIGWPIAFCMATSCIIAYIVLGRVSMLGCVATFGYQGLSSYSLLALPIFILMGEILIHGGVVSDLFDAVLPLTNRISGGLIYAVILANIVLGACCGSTVAATSAMSTVAIPELKKRNYSKLICYGVLSSSGNLSALIPPSVGMIIFCSITTVSLGKLFIAGIIPGLILGLALALVSSIWIKIKPDLVPPTEKELIPIWKAMFIAIKKLWTLLILIFLVLGVIYIGIASPTESGCYGVVGALLLAWRKKMVNRKVVAEIVISTTKVSVSILFIIAMAQLYGFALNQLGFRQLIEHFLENLSFGTYTKIFLIWIIFLVLGMFIDSGALIMITTPIFLPFFVQLGYEPLWFGVFVLIVTCLGNITPPVGCTLFAVQAISGDNIGIISKGSFPYWLSFLITSIAVVLFPKLSTWLPNIL